MWIIFKPFTGYLTYGKSVSKEQKENIINVMTNEFPAGSGKKTYAQCVFKKRKAMIISQQRHFLKCYQIKIFIILLKNLLILE